jgi:hypothetical protein
LLAAACSKKSDEEPVAAAPAAAEVEKAPGVGEPPAPPAEEPVPDPEELPVAEDFEEQAEAEISADNYRAELDQLADDIEGVPAE